MNIEKAIQKLQIKGGERGKTATPGNTAYERAKALDFVPCECSKRDAKWTVGEYIARTPRGAYMYVGLSRRGVISCGGKGYHYLTGTAECI